MADSKSPKNEVTRADYYLKQFEKKADQSNGVPFKVPYEGKEALKRIKDLKQRFPDDASVNDLFERARKALLASKGEGQKVPPEALAYRNKEKQLQQKFGQKANEAWQKRLEAARSEGQLIETPFPVPSFTDDEGGAEAHIGKYVLLEEFRYPANQFNASGGSYLFSGSYSGGFYFSQLHERPFITAYEALKRFRDAVAHIPEDAEWKVLGKIVGVDVMVPAAGEKPTARASEGWLVDVVSIHIPDTVTTFAAQQGEVDGKFASEDELQELKQNMFTVTEVPDGASPEEVIEVFAQAIKEKNLDLYFKCLVPHWTSTELAKSRAMYYWRNNQQRYQDMYVLVEPIPEKTEIKILRGEKIDATEDFFMTEEDQSEVLGFAEELLEEATVWLRRYRENGRQIANHPVFLRREGEGEWRVNSGFPL